MAKEEFLAKFKWKDYNNELEIILEKKDFSSDVKNLLLSMFYKMESGYADYAKTKMDVLSKQEMMEEIIQDVKEHCNKIELLTPLLKEGENSDKKSAHYKIKKKEGYIEVFPNEKDLLKAIYAISERVIYVPEKYKTEEKAIQEFLNKGHIADSFECMRDFNGWSWYTADQEIEQVSYNLIYQNIRILTNSEILNDWINHKEDIDYIEKLREKLKEAIDINLVEKLMRQFSRTVFKIYLNKDSKRKEALNKDWKEKELELKQIEQKDTYLEEISSKKKKAINQVNRIDKIINDKELLNKEFVKRNKNKKENEKLFSVSELAEILEKEKEEALVLMKQYTEWMQPFNYIRRVNRLKQELEFFEGLKLEEKASLEEDLITFQKIFLECYEEFLERADTKKKLIELIVTFRYYVLLYYNHKKQIKDLKELKDEINKIQRELIRKAIDIKLINTVSHEEEVNFKVLSHIFELRLIDLEELEIMFRKTEKDEIRIEFLDKENIEKVVTIENKLKKKEIKLNKKIKVFA